MELVTLSKANPKEGSHGKKDDWKSLCMWWHKQPVPETDVTLG
ncbi:hypothetical protein THARTR1_08061 [Trichoderma harzianum]|uniref:Uncharacterized protein n=1 Tax=Trichoderma harzianum TaxID=5544 RepID=A0A2K0U0I9_TRIHA|nr:hypothetical protein THARTR1_08061 [Trichoderma harzianum]